MGAFATSHVNDARITKAGQRAHMFAIRRNDPMRLLLRHARPCAGHPRLVSFPWAWKTWIAPELGLARVPNLKAPQVG